MLSGDINKAAQQWEEQFLNVMEQCIPKVTITPGCNLPWLTKDLQQAFRARNLAYKCAKRTGCPDHFDQYKLLRNKATSMLRNAKRNYFQNFKPSDSKAFWKTAKLITPIIIILLLWLLQIHSKLKVCS